MATISVPSFVQTPQLDITIYGSGDTNTNKTIFTAGSNGSKVVGIVGSNSDGDRTFSLRLKRGSTVAQLTSVLLASGAGNISSIPSIDFLNSTNLPGLPVDNDGQRYLFLESADIISVGLILTSGMTQGKDAYFTVIAGDF